MTVSGPIVVYGATGVTGRRCVAELETRGLPYVVAGRRADALNAVAGPGCVGVVVAAAEELAVHLAGAGALLSAAGPFLRFGEAVLDAAISAGVPYVDTTAEAAFVARAVGRDALARDAAIAATPACGVEYLPMLVAAARLGPGPVDTWLWLDDFVPTPGSVRSMVAMAGQGAAPRPIRHVTGDREGWHVRIPGVEAVLVHPASRTHLMLGRWEAAPFRWAWPVARWLPLPWLGDAIADRMPVPDQDAQASAAFTVVVSQGDRALRIDGGDVYGSTARYVVEVARALASGEATGAGVRSVAEVLDPQALVDALDLDPVACPVPRPARG